MDLMHASTLPITTPSAPRVAAASRVAPAVAVSQQEKAAASSSAAKASFWSAVQTHILWFLGATLFFNLVDAVLTLALVTAGLAVEANPVMAYFLELGPIAFMVAKLSLVSVGVGVLWYFRRYQLALAGTLAVFGIYTLLIAYHTRSILVLIENS